MASVLRNILRQELDGVAKTTDIDKINLRLDLQDKKLQTIQEANDSRISFLEQSNTELHKSLDEIKAAGIGEVLVAHP